jgi:structural maintenance of chromosome 2
VRFEKHSFYLSNIQYKYKTKNGSFFKNLTNRKTKFLNKIKKSNIPGQSILKNLNFQAKKIRNLFKSLNDNHKNMPITKSKSNKTFDINFFEKISVKYDNFLFKRLKIEKDRVYIEEIITQIEGKKNDIIFLAIQKINTSFGVIFKSMLPFHEAKITAKKNILGKINGINFCIFSLNIRKNLNELSGGQRSILSLCFIFSLLIFRTSPFYILDEVDAALDFCSTKNISQMMLKTFSFAQFIIISLKKQIISDAEVIFEIGNMSSRSVVTRFVKRVKK